MNFRPLHDRIVVRRAESTKVSKGGVLIPDMAADKPQEGDVLAVGPGARDAEGKIIAPSLSAGDRIVFGKWSGAEVEVDGETVIVMKESDVLGVVASPRLKAVA